MGKLPHMGPPNLLHLGNPRKMKQTLASILPEDALAAIESEIEKHVKDLYRLGLQHFRFAISQPPRHCRKKASRLYYAAYNVSRSVRLYVHGEYSIEAGDHGKVGQLPDDFPNKATFSNQLRLLREDRNTADYDHVSQARTLVLSPSDADLLVKNFLTAGKYYLHGRGLTVRGKP